VIQAKGVPGVTDFCAHAGPRAACLAALAIGGLLATSAAAQGGPDFFGNRARIDAANTSILLAVQQGVSALPPATAQGREYRYDRDLDTFVPTKLLGPTAFRRPESIEPGRFAARMAISYFDLERTLTPVVYEARPQFIPVPVYTAFGLRIDASVTAVQWSAQYGVTRGVDVGITVPVVYVDASTDSIFPARQSSLPSDPQVVALTSLDKIRNVARGIPESYVDVSSGNLETAVRTPTELSSSSALGLGRISVSSNFARPLGEPLVVAFNPEIFLPSPSEGALAGPASVGLLGRVVAGLDLTPRAVLLVAAGYEYDTEFAELRRALWDVGLSWGFEAGSLDLGFGGSKYDEPIQWTPREIEVEGSDVRFQVLDGEQITLGTTFVDFKLGAKLRLTDALSLVGAAVVPLTEDGVQPAAFGTLGIEAYL
jgi:hypothetical protein